MAERRRRARRAKRDGSLLVRIEDWAARCMGLSKAPGDPGVNVPAVDSALYATARAAWQLFVSVRPMQASLAASVALTLTRLYGLEMASGTVLIDVDELADRLEIGQLEEALLRALMFGPAVKKTAAASLLRVMSAVGADEATTVLGMELLVAACHAATPPVAYERLQAGVDLVIGMLNGNGKEVNGE